jgi:FG-GAP-like repeat/Abnormal spindle-like microcephaly-assoc'd, ASPM-SPD-2-Hydin
MRVLLPSIAAIARLMAILSLLGAVSASVAQVQVGFFTPPTYAGNGPVFVADFNGDRKPDILAADGTLSLGKGDGTFATGTSVAGQPLAVADFNGDGKPDVLEQGQGTLMVLLGNGDGTFQPPISTSSGASLTSIATADLNGDGDADVVGFFNGNALVYLSKGDGTFAAGVSYAVGSTPIVPTVTLEDFNGDHKIDIAVNLPGDNVPGQEVVLLGNGDGTFQAGKTTTGVPAGSVVAGDFNSDGKLDLVISSPPDCNGTCGSPTTSILLGNGEGTFQAPTTAFSDCGMLATADLNGDGRLDLVLVNGVAEIYLGNGDGTFSNTHSYHPPLALIPPLVVAIADFNLDGKPDVAAAGGILLGNGDGTFKGWAAAALPPYGVSATAVGDFDNNGTQDVAALSTNNATSLYVLINDGTGALSLAHTYTLQQPGYAIATADLNGDGKLDLVVASTSSITGDWGYSVLLGNGDGTFQSPAFYAQNVAGTNASTIVIADFNNDHKLDLAISAGIQTFAVLLGNGDGTFGPPAYVYDGDGGPIVGADFNRDGNIDIAEVGKSGMAILLGVGDGAFQPATFPFTTAFEGLLTADLNGDGKPDLVANTGSSASQVFLGNGDGTFKALSPLGQFLSVLADINGDGKLDAVGGRQFSSQDSDRGFSLGNGDGTFGPYIVVFPYFDGTNFVQAADMNGDEKADLIVVDDSTYSIFVLINTSVSVAGASFSPGSVTFPPQTVGTSSNPTPVTLTNPGTATLMVKSVTFNGADAGEFMQTNNCTAVQPSASCTIKVTFAPTAVGGASANLVVADNAGTGSQQVVVSGTGAAAAPGFAISAPAPSPASVFPGSSAATTVTITSVGGFNQSVALACGTIMLNGSPAATAPPTCKFSPSSVSNASGTSTLTISTTGPTASLAPVSTRSRALFYAMLLPILGIAVIGAGFDSGPKKPVRTSLACLMISGLLFLAACGGGSSGGGGTRTPAGTYTFSISGSAGSVVEKPITVTLIVQ